MKNLIKLSYLFLFAFAISCTQESTLDTENLTGVSAKASSKQTAPIAGLLNNNEVAIAGTATLHRNKNGITVNFKAENLNPGTYTIWWVIWNNPRECIFPRECNEPDFPVALDNPPNPDNPNPDNIVGVEVMYAGGHVVGNNGKGNFSAHLNAGDDTPESMNTRFGFISVGGLAVENTFGAEVHVVLRTHGPAVPGLVNEQINSYEGGCDTPFLILPFTEYPDEIGQCADIAAAVFAPAN